MRLRTLCVQENVNFFRPVLELPAAAQGAQQPFCAIAIHLETPGPRNTETKGDEARSRKRKREKAKSSSQLVPFPRRQEKLAFLSNGHSALPSICQAAAGTLWQLHRWRSWRFAVFGGRRGGGCLFREWGGKGSQNAGQGRMPGRGRRLSGWGAQAAVWSREPNIGPNSCRRLVCRWSSGSHNLQTFGLCIPSYPVLWASGASCIGTQQRSLAFKTSRDSSAEGQKPPPASPTS